ncbi:MAG: HlyD family efflux transporter periplasmic adaptor subunit [Chloroflexota bacterium]|nr:HlyD family efflux transporter periplasmic adaptor subunit [Chloroflexota bacterium]
MFNNPFREEAATSRNERQQLDRLLRITAPHERIILAGVAVVLAAFVAWALLGRIDRSISFDGVVVEPGARHEVVSTEPGQLLEIAVAPGDHVEGGDAIARQTVPEIEREAAALHNRVALLESELAEAGADSGAVGALLDAARAALLEMEARREARALIVSQGSGVITALRAATGDYVPAGAAVVELRESEDRPPHAVLRASRDAARRIEPGMEASVEIEVHEGAAQLLRGEVASVTAEPLPHWLAALLPAAGEAAYRVDVALDEAPKVGVPEGTSCRIRIELGRNSPAALLALGPS